MQFIKWVWPDVWYMFRACVKFVINMVLWLLILMLGGFVSLWIMPHSFNHTPNWLDIFILNPLCNLIWIFYMAGSFLWVFNPKITETDVLVFKILYAVFESLFNFRSWQNFLKGVCLMAIFLLSVRWIGGYFIAPPEAEDISKKFKFIEELN